MLGQFLDAFGNFLCKLYHFRNLIQYPNKSKGSTSELRILFPILQVQEEVRHHHPLQTTWGRQVAEPSLSWSVPLLCMRWRVTIWLWRWKWFPSLPKMLRSKEAIEAEDMSFDMKKRTTTIPKRDSEYVMLTVMFMGDYRRSSPNYINAFCTILPKRC